MTASTRNMIFGAILVAAIAAVGFYVFVLGDEPDAVSISEAADALAVDASEEANDAVAAQGDVDPQGTWAVDTDVQPFSFDETSGTFLGFRIDEELSRIGANTAVGRTPVVSGSLTLAGTTIDEAIISGDLSAITTDDSRRDNRTRSALGVSENPLATFELTEPIDLQAAPALGDSFTAPAIGTLTINGVTNTVEVDLEAVLSDAGILIITGSFDVLLADYEVTPPSAPIVASVSDVATVEIQLYLARA